LNRKHDKLAFAEFVPGVVSYVRLQEVFNSDNFADEGTWHHAVQLLNVESLTRIHTDFAMFRKRDPILFNNLCARRTARKAPNLLFNFCDVNSWLSNSSSDCEALDELDFHLLDNLAAVRVVNLVNDAYVLAEIKVLFWEDDCRPAHILEEAQEAADFANQRDWNRLCLYLFARLKDVDEPHGVDSRQRDFAGRVPARTSSEVVPGRRREIFGLDEVDRVERDVLSDQHVFNHHLGVPLVVGQHETARQPVRYW